MFQSATRKRRLIGGLLLVAFLAVFLTLSRAPKLDTVREDLTAATSVGASEVCFQGYCTGAAADPDLPAPAGPSLASRWWTFTSTYLELVTIGMIFAFLVAGLTEVFFFPRQGGAVFRGTGWRGTLRGLATGTPMTLCSACIVPVANAIGRRGGRAESIVAVVQGSSTMNLPALIMLFAVFSPMLAGSRIAISLIGALALGPLVALAAGQRRRAGAAAPVVDVPILDVTGWGQILREGLRDWLVASFGYLLRLGPIMIAAAMLSGLVIQGLNADTVEAVLSNSVSGVMIAAVFGVLINVPLLFEIPLVALLLVLGMGAGPGAALLFTAAAAGPITFWGLTKVIPPRAVATYAASTWMLGVLVGVSVLAIGSLSDADNFGVRDAALASDVATIVEADNDAPVRAQE